jgi:Protein of unknown function (DUF3224)
MRVTRIEVFILTMGRDAGVIVFALVFGFIPHPEVLGSGPAQTFDRFRPIAAKKGLVMTMHAHGPFDVNIIPQLPEDRAEGLTLGRMLLDKHFHGDLEAGSKGQMLTGMTEVKGSGAYVAIERVTGTLNGRSGSFLLHHLGIMTRGVPQLDVTVVPDSGTGELTGIAGKMNINIVGGKHTYDFAYSLPVADGSGTH